MSTPTLEYLSPSALMPSPNNPRIIREDDPTLASLAESIKNQGLLEPILVRPVTRSTSLNPVPGDDRVQNVNASHEIIAGERRWRATKLAGLSTVPALVHADLTDQQALELTVTENLQREDLHPLEEANGVASLLKQGEDYRAVAARLGQSLGWVAGRARLAKLSEKWRALVANPAHEVSRWTVEQLQLIARLEPDAQDLFLSKIPDWRLNGSNPYGLDGLKREIANYTHELKLASWGLDDATLHPAAGACLNCQKRSACNPGLFDEAGVDAKTGPGDTCLDTVCWNEKAERTLAARAAELRAEHPDLVFVNGGDVATPIKAKFLRGQVVHQPWAGANVKKGDKGALPAMVVSGADAGKLKYLRFNRTSASVLPASRDAKPAKPTAEQTARRREARAKELLVTALGKMKAPPLAKLCRLAAAFMSYESGIDLSKVIGKGPVEPFEVAAAFKKESQLIEALWLGVREFCGYSGHDATLQQMASAVGVDAAPYLAAATREIPDAYPAKEPEKKAAAKETAKAKAKPAQKSKAQARKAS